MPKPHFEVKQDDIDFLLSKSAKYQLTDLEEKFTHHLALAQKTPTGQHHLLAWNCANKLAIRYSIINQQSNAKATIAIAEQQLQALKKLRSGFTILSKLIHYCVEEARLCEWRNDATMAAKQYEFAIALIDHYPNDYRNVHRLYRQAACLHVNLADAITRIPDCNIGIARVAMNVHQAQIYLNKIPYGEICADDLRLLAKSHHMLAKSSHFREEHKDANEECERAISAILSIPFDQHTKADKVTLENLRKEAAHEDVEYEGHAKAFRHYGLFAHGSKTEKCSASYRHIHFGDVREIMPG